MESFSAPSVGEKRSIDLWFNHQRSRHAVARQQCSLKKTPSFQRRLINCSAEEVKGYYSLTKQGKRDKEMRAEA